MSKKAKWILIIVGTVLIIAGAIVFLVQDVTPTQDEDITPDSTQVDSVALPMVDSLVVDSAEVAE